jgi:hypothetical protein
MSKMTWMAEISLNSLLEFLKGLVQSDDTSATLLLF